MAAPALAIGAAEEASGRSFEALSAKMNVHVPLPRILSHKHTKQYLIAQHERVDLHRPAGAVVQQSFSA